MGRGEVEAQDGRVDVDLPVLNGLCGTGVVLGSQQRADARTSAPPKRRACHPRVVRDVLRDAPHLGIHVQQAREFVLEGQ